MTRLPTRVQISAGGVLFRRRNSLVEVAVTRHKDMHGNDVWTLPKGLVEGDESPEETALREVEEETGLKGKIVDKIAESTYWFAVPQEGVRYKKTVHFYLMEYLSGDTAHHDWEVEEVQWMEPERAMELLSYRGEREILSRALALLKERIP